MACVFGTDNITGIIHRTNQTQNLNSKPLQTIALHCGAGTVLSVRYCTMMAAPLGVTRASAIKRTGFKCNTCGRASSWCASPLLLCSFCLRYVHFGFCAWGLRLFHVFGCCVVLAWFRVPVCGWPPALHGAWWVDADRPACDHAAHGLHPTMYHKRTCLRCIHFCVIV